MDHSQHHYYNALARYHQGDYHAITASLRAHGTPSAAWNALPSTLRPNPAAEWRALEARGVRLILAHDADYPPLLKEIPHPPHALYARGALPACMPAIAVVGTRRATAEGMRIARDWSAAFARAGALVVSGLAFGIDRSAHEGALDSARATIAVLPAGLDAVYPRAHADVARRILEREGTLVSEYPFGTQPYPARFIERNRIVSGLARAVLVIEAPAGSGALATARFAAEQNRDVFAVPGAITNRNYEGSNALIKEGAGLAASPLDILQSLGIEPLAKPNLWMSDIQRLGEATPEVKTILAACKAANRPLTVDMIAELTTLNIRAVNQAVAILVINGILSETAHGYEPGTDYC
jgi:DNA processing protein